MSEDSKVALHREVTLHKELLHPHIIRLYNSFKHNECLYIILEYMSNGNIFKLIRQRTLHREQAMTIFAQILSAVAFFHGRKIIHRDIKPENILWNANGEFKLSDFGFCGNYTEGAGRKTMCGTTEYIAPEVVMNDRQDDKLDIWCMGVLLFEMLHFRPPYQVKNTYWLMQEIKSKALDFDPKLPSELCDIIRACMNIEPRHRPSATELLEHPAVRAALGRPGRASAESPPKSLGNMTRLPEDKNLFKKPVNQLSASTAQTAVSHNQLQTHQIQPSSATSKNFGITVFKVQTPGSALNTSHGNSSHGSSNYSGHGGSNYSHNGPTQNPVRRLKDEITPSKYHLEPNRYQALLNTSNNDSSNKKNSGYSTESGVHKTEKSATSNLLIRAKTDSNVAKHETSQVKQSAPVAFSHKRSVAVTEAAKPLYTGSLYRQDNSAKPDNIWKTSSKKIDPETVKMPDYHETRLYSDSMNGLIAKRVIDTPPTTQEFVNIYHKDQFGLFRTQASNSPDVNVKVVRQGTGSFQQPVQQSAFASPATHKIRPWELDRTFASVTNQESLPAEKISSSSDQNDNYRRFYSAGKFKTSSTNHLAQVFHERPAADSQSALFHTTIGPQTGSQTHIKRTTGGRGSATLGANPGDLQPFQIRSVSRGVYGKDEQPTAERLRFTANPFAGRKA